MATKKTSLLNQLIADAQEALPTNDELTTVSALALRLVDQYEKKAKLEAELAEINASIRALEIQDLPDAMTAAGGLTLFKLSNGATVEIKLFVEASLPKEDPDKREKALAWLLKNAPDIVKHEVSLGFTKGEQAKARKAIDLLRKAGFDNVVDVTTVHHATLKAYVKDQVTNGIKVPLDLFQGYVGEKATVKLPKGK